MAKAAQRFIYADETTPEQTWRLVEWCIMRGTTEFSVAVLGRALTTPFDEFAREMARFRLPDAARQPGSYDGEGAPSVVPL